METNPDTISNLEIKVVCGVGSGRTILSSFDSALKDAGVYNYNLITLSSIIPPGSKVNKIRRAFHLGCRSEASSAFPSGKRFRLEGLALAASECGNIPCECHGPWEISRI